MREEGIKGGKEDGREATEFSKYTPIASLKGGKILLKLLLYKVS